MSKTRDTGNIGNVVRVDANGNVSFVSGSTTLMSVSSSGAVTTTGVISGSNAANALLLSGTGSVGFTTTSSFLAVSSSQQQISASLLNVIATSATTGSNTFTKPQYVSDTSNGIGFTSTASFYTDGGLRVGKNAYVSGTAYFNNIVVFGTSSIEYVTSSNFSISDNIISVNTFSPAVRFGGISVFDSGSTASSGSLLWDSEQNRWVYSNPSGSTYDGGMLISGPRNTTGLGNEQGTTSCMLLVGQGGDHLTSSMIYHSTTCTSFYSNTLFVTSSERVGIGVCNIRDTFVVGLNGGAVLERFTGTDPYSGDLYFYSARGTSSSPTTKCNGDVVMGIRPRAYDGTSYLDVASIVSKIDGAVSTNAMYGNLIFSTNNGGTTLTERMRITSAGNIGIGTCSPSRKLIIQGGSTNAGLEILSTNGYRSAIIAGRGSSGTASDQGYFQMTDQGTAAVVLDTAGNSYVNGGNFGVKTTNPTSGLFQVGDAGITAQNTYFGTGQVRVGGGSDHGSNTVLSVAPGVVTFDRPGVGGGALTINSSGYITLPSQPSFLAVSNASQQDYTSGQVIVFNLTRHNTSSGYNTSTGKFTAPVAGRYLFSVNFYTYVNYSVAITLTINGSQYAPGDLVPLIYKPSDTVTVNLGFSIILELAASDYVEVRTRSGYTARVYMSHSHFAGQLLS